MINVLFYWTSHRKQVSVAYLQIIRPFCLFQGEREERFPDGKVSDRWGTKRLLPFSPWGSIDTAISSCPGDINQKVSFLTFYPQCLSITLNAVSFVWYRIPWSSHVSCRDNGTTHNCLILLLSNGVQVKIKVAFLKNLQIPM